MQVDRIDQIAADERRKREVLQKTVCVCAGAGCLASGAASVLDQLQKRVRSEGRDKEIRVVSAGCMGPCNQGPLVRVLPDEAVYQHVTPEWLNEIYPALTGDVAHAEAAAHHLLFSENGRPGPVRSMSHPFYRRQKKIVLENCGMIDPESLEDYIANGGYKALHWAVTRMSPEEVIAEVKHSGLRGRGGAGFPAGIKWETVYKYTNPQKYVICNGDEGDPGAFMDRSVLEGDPHRVIEGMAMAGYAVGANKGYLYVRAEYPLAIKRFEHAIRRAKAFNLIGRGVFGTSYDFEIEIRVGAGAFVCGEETALISSIEGKRGSPRPRPPYPAESGLWGKPTLINNVETFASVPPILMKGGGWFAAIGTPRSAGTKVFALAGKVLNTGLIEVPMGMTLREIIFEIGGGIPKGKKFKAAQTGGPSGGCIPEQHLDVKMDYESLVGLGSIMGSGGLIVMDETSCMVDVARFFMEFCVDESCGKCVPCRVGTKQMFDLLTKICNGQATERDLALLEELAPMVRETSLCGLGMTAPNPLASTLRYFRDEYMAHIREKRCPAGVCRLPA